MKTEKKLTALQGFIDRLKNDFGFVVSNNVTDMYLEKEKQQIINAGNNCYLNSDLIKRSIENKKVHSIGEQYYQENYKK